MQKKPIMNPTNSIAIAAQILTIVPSLVS